MDNIVFNKAKWQKSCYNKFGHDRLDSTQTRKRAENEAESSMLVVPDEFAQGANY